MAPEEITLGQRAYEKYVSMSARVYPPWRLLSKERQLKWEQVAHIVVVFWEEKQLHGG